MRLQRKDLFPQSESDHTFHDWLPIEFDHLKLPCKWRCNCGALFGWNKETKKWDYLDD